MASSLSDDIIYAIYALSAWCGAELLLAGDVYGSLVLEFE